MGTATSGWSDGDVVSCTVVTKGFAIMIADVGRYVWNLRILLGGGCSMSVNDMCVRLALLIGFVVVF